MSLPTGGGEGLRFLRERARTGRYLFHGSSDPDIEVFVPRVIRGNATGPGGLRLQLKPLIFATASLELAGTLAAAVGIRGWGPGGIGFCTYEFTTDRLASTLSASEQVLEALQNPAAIAAHRPTVYGFERKRDGFGNDFPIPGEWVTSRDTKPVFSRSLDAADIAALIAVTMPFETVVAGGGPHGVFDGAGMCREGGQFQHSLTGLLLEWRPLTTSDYDLARSLEAERARRFIGGGFWGDVIDVDRTSSALPAGHDSLGLSPSLTGTSGLTAAP